MSAENPHAGQGMVVLDIGDGVGALVVSAPAAMADLEIEICPAGARHQPPDEGADWWAGQWRTPPDPQPHQHDHHHHQHDHHHHDAGAAWPHVAVLPRPTPDGPQYAAVFPGLRAGDYELWLRPDGPTALTATVVDGRVASGSWPDPR